MPSLPIHPFPARIAPEVVQGAIDELRAGATVLDPMCGSGTVLRTAVERGMEAVGTDVDPLAVLMSKVWVTPLDREELGMEAREVVARARAMPSSARCGLEDRESEDFAAFWFARTQAEALARLATILRRDRWENVDALTLGLSRIVVSKGMQASLARDTSHSRPHRVAKSNVFDVYGGFLRAVDLMGRRMGVEAIVGHAEVRREDARRLVSVEDKSVDGIVTSPPYLNAIDYLRGHRLALVWLGYSVAEIREIRSGSIGAERVAAGEIPGKLRPFVSVGKDARIERRHLGWIRRYLVDMGEVLVEMRRVLRPEGMAVLVVGNSVLRGARVDNAGIVEALAAERGFRCVRREVREIPAHRRYLPPPVGGAGTLDSRMKREVVLYLA